MSYVTRGLFRAPLAAVLAAGLLTGAGVCAHAAPKAEKKESANTGAGAGAGEGKASDSQSARRALEAGAKAYAAGRYQNTVDQLNVALRGGGLGTPDMAKGLYYRGAAYRKLNKPGLAISDLTSALWLKNGLSDADRAAATAERAEAYKAAGIAEADTVPAPAAARGPDVASPAVPVARTPSPPAPVVQAAPLAQAGTTTKMAATVETGVPQPLSLGAETVAAAPTRVGTPRADQSAAGAAIDQLAALEQPYRSSAPAATTAAAPTPVLSAAPMEQGTPPPAGSVGNVGVGSAITGFFSNIFGGASGPTGSSQDTLQTASTGPATPAPIPQTSSWANSASLTKADAKAGANTAGSLAAKAATKTAAASGGASAPASGPALAPAKAKGGKFKLHIAAVRSRVEADALAQRLNAEHGAAFANRSAAVDEAVIGSMGTFYRVRVGGYATADEPRGLCNTLRNSGYDCLVVTN